MIALHKFVHVVAAILLGLRIINASEESTTESTSTERDPSYMRVMVMHFPRPAEPFSYPGPSPSVQLPPRTPDPYPAYIPPNPYIPRLQHLLDFNSLPKWCQSMWERDECGMKCWMLRKICRNIARQQSMKEDSVEGSSSIAYPQLKPMSNYYSPKKPQHNIIYGKTGLSNTYYAQPMHSHPWHYPSYYYKKPYYPKYTHYDNEFGLNPQFTYLDGNEIKTTTQKPKEVEENATEGSKVTTVKPTGETTTSKPFRTKGAYAVKVKLNYPPDSEVTTLSPMMFEYDQYNTRGYYGDRIYMSAVMPVSDRQQRSDNNDYDSYDDFDEMMIEP